MSMRWYVAKRIAWTVIAFYLILSGLFLVFAYTPDPNDEIVAFLGGQDAAEAYREARNYDEPLVERWWNWIVSYSTFDFGTALIRSPGGDGETRSVNGLLLQTGRVTLVYIVPAILLSTLVGTALGLYAAMNAGGIVDRAVTAIAYSGLGIPAFFLGELIVLIMFRWLSWYRTYYDMRYGLFTIDNLHSLTLPMLVVALNLVVVQLRYARAESLDYVPRDFVKTLRAGGANAWDVARHVLRNASLPLVSLFFTETLTVLFVTVYVVELVFKVPGYGTLAFSAINNRDMATILATTMVPIYVGLLGNLVQDITYTYLDPRIEYGDR